MRSRDTMRIRKIFFGPISANELEALRSELCAHHLEVVDPDADFLGVRGLPHKERSQVGVINIGSALLGPVTAQHFSEKLRRLFLTFKHPYLKHCRLSSWHGVSHSS
ncbi:hypothetical protein LPC08_23275 [Roseomonas sp. OT10]|nr:hypothetical protein [Roseomonas sp. OT10]UFN48883.1 hypothetical protein LPC08_23275 [Roseomonas sp. OT10]